MEIGEYEIFCLRTFNELFKNAKAKSKEKFITALLSLDEETTSTTLSCTQEAEFHELSSLVNDVLRIVSSPKVEKPLKARMRLFAYCHIMQVHSIYLIISNLSGILLNQDMDPVVYYINKSGNRHNCYSNEEKIRAIKIKSAPLDIPLDTVYDFLYYPKILDAFITSQYLLSEGSNLVLMKKIQASTSSTVKRYFRYSELKNIFDKSLVYLHTFMEIFGSHLNEFRDGNEHETLFGRVRFDSERGWALRGKAPRQ